VTTDQYTIERCRSESCRAPIIWACTVNGELMPVDAEPDPLGNVELVPPAPCGAAPTAVVHAPDQPLMFGTELRLPHFATCPDAARWRKA
jgi:hypothetical protein